MQIVENGSGLANADSYLSDVEADAYFLNLGGTSNTTWAAVATAALKQDAIKRGTQYLDARFNGRWRGVRAHETQALAFPRSSIVDSDGFVIANTLVPTKLKHATAEAALRALTDDLMPDISSPGLIASEGKRIGPLSKDVSYIGGKSQITWFRKLDRLLSDLVLDGSRVMRC